MSGTTIAKGYKPENKQWHLVDANGLILGRLAAKVAMILMGKHKPTYTRHIDTGDHVVIVNADKIRVTGNKLEQKNYKRYSGYPGGLKETPLEVLLEKDPAQVVRKAVGGMLPKTTLGHNMLKKLQVYKGEDHPHQAQKPVELKF